MHPPFSLGKYGLMELSLSSFIMDSTTISLRIHFKLGLQVVEVSESVVEFLFLLKSPKKRHQTRPLIYPSHVSPKKKSISPPFPLWSSPALYIWRKEHLPYVSFSPLLWEWKHKLYQAEDRNRTKARTKKRGILFLESHNTFQHISQAWIFKLYSHPPSRNNISDIFP